MVIQHRQNGANGMFFIPGEEDDDGLLAEMTYLRQEPDTMIIEHTEVSDELRGQNIGYQLVHTAVEYARTHHLKIIPMCTFAKAVIDKKPEFRDVLEEGGR
jgi:predicted GNAT family acetyltransferase